MATAWKNGGAPVDLNLLPAYGDDGHELVDDRAGWDLWGPTLARFLDIKEPSQAVARAPGTQPGGSGTTPLVSTVAATADGEAPQPR
jgi:hypothetical protein